MMKIVPPYGETLPTIFPLLQLHHSATESFDNDFVTESQLTEEDVTWEALETVQSAE